MQLSVNKTRLLLLSLPILALAFWLLFYTNEYAPFSLLGLLGAIFANATGAGGGVVFIPAFQQLGVSEAQSVATSFAIQCFGMTMGSIVWLKHARRCEFPDWKLLPKLGENLFALFGSWHLVSIWFWISVTCQLIQFICLLLHRHRGWLIIYHFD